MTQTYTPARVYTAIHQGGRPVQQDAYAFVEHESATASYVSAIIADGMGGHPQSGHIASAAVKVAARLAGIRDYEWEPQDLLRDTRALLGAFADWTSGEISQAFTDFDDAGVSDKKVPNAAVAVAHVSDCGNLTISWLGDCRVYAMGEDDQLRLLTTDHNLRHRGRPDLVTRSLARPNGEIPQQEILVSQFRARRVLLCTDGLYAPLSDPRGVSETIRATLADRSTPPEYLVARLVEVAVDAEGEHADNASAVLIDIPARTDAGATAAVTR